MQVCYIYLSFCNADLLPMSVFLHCRSVFHNAYYVMQAYFCVWLCIMQNCCHDCLCNAGLLPFTFLMQACCQYLSLCNAGLLPVSVFFNAACCLYLSLCNAGLFCVYFSVMQVCYQCSKDIQNVCVMCGPRKLEMKKRDLQFWMYMKVS